MKGQTLHEISDGQIKLMKFLGTRRNDQTREYTRLILERLRNGEEVDIRFLLDQLVPDEIPNESTFFRIIKDLSNREWGILERREDTEVIRRGKAPVYYKLKIALPLPPKQATFNNHQKFSIEGEILTRRYLELAIAKEIIGKDRKLNRQEVDSLIKRELFKKYGDPESDYAEIMPDNDEDS